MSLGIKGYRVFIASPRGLEDERQKFFETIQEYNHIEALPVNIQFIPVGWEYTLPGIGRSQSIINEEVQICDYFLLILWDRWGTSPDKDGKGKYSSGSEEEYHVALDCFENSKLPMKQIVTLFKSVNERQLSDPGKELQKVLDFKKRLEEKKEILFKTFEGSDDFEKILRGLLGQWRRDGEQGKTAKIKKPKIPPNISEITFEPEQNLKAMTEQTRKIIKQAKKLADEGKVTEAEELFAKAVVNSGESYAYNAYGTFLRRVGRLGQAKVMCEKSLDISTMMEDEKGVATSYNRLGIIYQKRGELDKAEEMLKKSLEISDRIGHLDGIANASGNLGIVYGTKGELDKAEEMYKKSLEIAEKLGLKEIMAASYCNLGEIYRTKGKIQKAEKMYKKSLEIAEKLGLKEIMAAAYGNLGLIYTNRGELDKAEEIHKKALEIAEKLGLQEMMAINYCDLGLVYKKRGELDKAEELFKKSLEIDERIGRQEGMANQYGNLGVIYMQRGDLGKAKEYWEKAQDLFQKIGMPNEVKRMEGWIEVIKEK